MAQSLLGRQSETTQGGREITDSIAKDMHGITSIELQQKPSQAGTRWPPSHCLCCETKTGRESETNFLLRTRVSTASKAMHTQCRD